MDAGRAEGRAFLAAEPMGGPSLAETLRAEGRQPAREVARIGLELAEILARAHARGVSHRGIEPEHVYLIGAERSARLAGFGLAAALESAPATRGLDQPAARQAQDDAPGLGRVAGHRAHGARRGATEPRAGGHLVGQAGAAHAGIALEEGDRRAPACAAALPEVEQLGQLAFAPHQRHAPRLGAPRLAVVLAGGGLPAALEAHLLRQFQGLGIRFRAL